MVMDVPSSNVYGCWFGASALALERIMRAFDYSLVAFDRSGGARTACPEGAKGVGAAESVRAPRQAVRVSHQGRSGSMHAHNGKPGAARCAHCGWRRTGRALPR
jgi:hypothetical protein